MEKLDLKTLGENIKEAFINQDQYVFSKVISDFKKDNEVIGDWFNYLMCDPTTKPPVFYEVSAPYDVISNKAPQFALVFQDGECILQTDYTEYAVMRTGIMDALVLSKLGATSLADKKILMCGAGKTASWSLQGLKAYFPDLKEVSYLTTETSTLEFEQLAESIGVKATHTIDKAPSIYDIIICHTDTKEAIFTNPSLIKPGAILTGFISSTSYGEFSDNFYDSKTANIIIDWEENLSRMPFIERPIEQGEVDKTKIYDLQKLFKEEYTPNLNAKYTIFTSIGTPTQNIALLKMLVENK